MSKVQHLPKQTRILIKDLLFQSRYKLSHTQMDLMAYLVNVPFWATQVEADYYVITSKKILSDLPHLHEKTLEATLKALKEGGFIESKLVDMPTWGNRHKVRAIKLTHKAKTYNDKLILPSQDAEVIRLKKALKASEEENKRLEKLLANVEVSNVENTSNISETMALASSKNDANKPQYTPNKDLVDFIEKTSRDFAKTGQNICNFVPSWAKESIFNINSYGKLSIKIDQNTEKQIKEASQINTFWLWLFENQHRVGDCIDFNKKLDFKGLKQRYIGTKLKIAKEIFRLSNLLSTKDGIAIEVGRGDKRMKLRNPQSKQTNYYTVEDCESLILGLKV